MDVNVERIAAAQAERAAKREQEEKDAMERQAAARARLEERSKEKPTESEPKVATAGPTAIASMTIELYENQTVHVEGPLTDPELYLRMISGATVVLCQQIQKQAIQHAVARIRDQVPQASRGFLERIISKAFPAKRA